ncbi:MAG TPA: hypothetical protein VHN79_13870, partial [Lacunisphaera sp.]|nr:hypothetical protein [Lacunisphaera sp.]
ARGEESGGYLRAWTVNEQKNPIPSPAAVLVGRAWSDAFDANSPRILTGREYCLLQKNNRVFAMEGVAPLNGVPDYVSEAASFDLLPHSASNLLIELFPRDKDDRPAATWQLSRQADGVEAFSHTVSGPPPWHLKIPLVPGKRNVVTINLTEFGASRENLPIALRSLRIEDSQ